MRFPKTSLIILISVLVFSCIKPLAVDFTTDKTQYTAGETVYFTNKTKNAKSYKWTFPDGSTSTKKDATYRIPDDAVYGTLPIKMEAQGIYKKTSTKSVTYNIFVYPIYGKVVFWKDVSCGCGLIDITIDNEEYNILASNTSISPGCGNPNATEFELTVGTHSYYATDGSRSWNGNFTITKNGCLDIKLN